MAAARQLQPIKVCADKSSTSRIPAILPLAPLMPAVGREPSFSSELSSVGLPLESSRFSAPVRVRRMRARSGHRSLAKRVFSGAFRSVLYASQHLGLEARQAGRTGPNGVTTSWTFSLERRCRNDAARFCCHSGGTLLRVVRAPLNSHSRRSVWRTYHIERYRSSVESSSVLKNTVSPTAAVVLVKNRCGTTSCVTQASASRAPGRT